MMGLTTSDYLLAVREKSRLSFQTMLSFLQNCHQWSLGSLKSPSTYPLSKLNKDSMVLVKDRLPQLSLANTKCQKRR